MDILTVGDVFFVYAVIRDAAGDQAASGDITLGIRKPDDTTEAAIVDDATMDDLDIINADNARNPDWTDLTTTTGVYVSNVDCDSAGNWWGRWSAEDPLTFAEQFAFYVYPQRVVVAP